MYRSMIITTLLAALTLKAAPNLNKDRLINLSVNCSGLTRIAVKNNKIQDVVVFPESYANKVNLHKSGQIFINTKNLPQQFQLSLLLQNGMTQDLKLQCANIEQGPIILENNPEPFSPEEAEFIERTLKAVLNGDFKDGTSISIEDVGIRKSSTLEWNPTKQWQKGDYFIQLFKTKNESEDSIVLRSYEFKESQDMAIAFDQETLAPKKKALMVVIRKQQLTEGNSHA